MSTIEDLLFNAAPLTKDLGDGREAMVMRTLFGARLHIGAKGSKSFDDTW